MKRKIFAFLFQKATKKRYYRHHSSFRTTKHFPFRGKNWDKETKQEYGNFTPFLRWKAEDVPALKDHLDNASYNAKYTS